MLGHTDGPDDALDPSKETASGKPKRRLKKIKPGGHGAAAHLQGDYVDHGGTDAGKINPNEPGNHTLHQDAGPGAEGEISHDEATGDVEEGGEV